MSKRFQECNWLQKMWRYRYYLYIPFKWTYYQMVGLKVRRHEDPTQYDVSRGKQLWRLLKGSAQCDMNFVHTTEEVMEMLKQK